MSKADARTSSERALAFIRDGSVVGLGTGHAASSFLRDLGAHVRSGLRIRGVATSETSASLAREVGIDLVGLDQVEAIDVTVDGADEVDPELDLIKGYGGALLREKIVAAASREVVILVGPEKLVPRLGTRGRLPVEVVPFGRSFAARRLAELGIPATVRLQEGRPMTTDNGNQILDCTVGPLPDPAGLDREIQRIPGVVTTGLFLGMARVVVVGKEGGVQVLERPHPNPEKPRLA